MAYCKECGAYIPDGHSKCLACGFNEAEAAKKAEQAKAYQYKYEEAKKSTTERLKEELEKQRARQQENSRKWAETEKAQRERAKNAQPHRSTDAKKYAAPTSYSASKILSALSYFGMLFILPYIFCDNDDFAKFHAKQGLNLFVASIVADIVASIFGLGWIVTIAKLYFIYKGVSNVLNGRKLELPYIGSLL
ncbi:MAG: hypothetical protein IIX72_03875 [Oscillospiraceae bacterium]|nr:hypothetical protein [Oscillospiraceae bacterium]